MKTPSRTGAVLALTFAFTFALVLTPAASLPAQTPPAPSAPADDVLGKAGAFEVRLSEVRQSLQALTEPEREALSREPAALNQYVRALLVQKLILREALAKQWDQSPRVTERLQLLKDGIIANTYLESLSTPGEGYPGEAELQAAYDASKDTLLQPKTWRLAQIFVAAATPDGEAKAGRLKTSLAAPGADFALLARALSEEPASAARDGEIGWLAEDQLHPEVRAVLPTLDLGQHTPAPVRMEDGWHFIKVLDIREAHTPTLQQIREPLAQRLRQEKLRAESQAFVGRLLEENPIAINEMLLSRLLTGEAASR